MSEPCKSFYSIGVLNFRRPNGNFEIIFFPPAGPPAVFFCAIFAHRAPERPQSNLYLKTSMFCKYKGFQGEENAEFSDFWELAEFLHAL